MAGVLGLTGLSGFLFFLLVMLVCSVAFLAKAGFNTKAYFDSPARITTDNLMAGGLVRHGHLAPQCLLVSLLVPWMLPVTRGCAFGGPAVCSLSRT